MRRWLRAATVLAVVVATALVVVVATAMAGTTQVSGSAVYNLECTPPAAAGTALVGNTGDYDPLDLSGSLDGCWYTYVETSKPNPSGTYKETGTELFVGCLNGTTCGRFTTTYTFTGKFNVEPPFEEIHGRCQHPVTGGTGGFAGMSGVIQFKDDVDNGIFYYRGNIKS